MTASQRALIARGGEPAVADRFERESGEQPAGEGERERAKFARHGRREILWEGNATTN
ncbi:hypothetical protein GCM10009788_16150 [Nocardioides humi]|uniref:Uncharacterized protein n=1 Tax=Nocardioides humi TaxID=449461 RepID=A0ABN2A6X3_9ACTN